MHLIGFFSKLKVMNVQQKNVLSQQNQLHFISYVSKERNLLKGEIQDFRQSSIPFGFASWAMATEQQLPEDMFALGVISQPIW